MAITFPAGPSDGDVFTNATTGVKYIYNATDGVWKTHVWPTNTDYLQLSGGTLTGDLSLGTNDLTAQDINSTTLTTTGGVTVGNGLTVSDGNVVMAAGHGIDFSATADATSSGSVSTSELLDDYEEGTWTPVVGETSNVITLSGGNQNFRYQKVGNMVTATFSLNDVTTSGATGGAFIIGGLPFVSSSIQQLRTIGTFAVYYGSGMRASNWPSMVHVGHSQTRADIYYKTSATGNYDRDTINSVGATTYFFWQITYMVD